MWACAKTEAHTWPIREPQFREVFSVINQFTQLVGKQAERRDLAEYFIDTVKRLDFSCQIYRGIASESGDGSLTHLAPAVDRSRAVRTGLCLPAEDGWIFGALLCLPAGGRSHRHFESIPPPDAAVCLHQIIQVFQHNKGCPACPPGTAHCQTDG